MAVRFRKSIKLAPGIRWNVSGSGSSWTFGPRGSTVNVGKRSTHRNSNFLGFSSRQQLPGPAPTPPEGAPAGEIVTLTCSINDAGELSFADASGAAMPEHLVEVAKKQNKEAILDLIQRKCDEINDQIEALGRLHHDTPDPRKKPAFVAMAFEAAEPKLGAPQRLSMLDKLFKSRRQRIEEANRTALQRHQDAMNDWRTEKAYFGQRLAARKALIENLIYKDTAAMESFLEERLNEIVWPRETLIALDIGAGGKLVKLDVDLPELEDMPTKLAVVPARGLKLSVKELSAAKVEKLYAEHVHGIMFRIVGEVFAALPTVETVVASGYSQRRDPATAQVRDDYLLSIRVQRSAWEKNDFDHLDAIEVTEALARYELRRDMLKSGKLKSIKPLA